MTKTESSSSLKRRIVSDHISLPSISSSFSNRTNTTAGTTIIDHTNTINSRWDTIIQNHNNTNTNNTTTSTPFLSTILPTLLRQSVQSYIHYTIYITICLYILNQKHMLPLSLSRIVSKVLNYPTLPITALNHLRYQQWYNTIIDDTIIMGGLPLFHIPHILYEQYGVRGVINLCDEYRGPMKVYEQLGIEQLYLPTIDHCEPSIHDMKRAIQFIVSYYHKKQRVYIHCRAGHGRSAAIVFVWLMMKYPNTSLQTLNEELYQLRNVRTTLYQQPNILQFHKLLQQEHNTMDLNDDMHDGDTSDTDIDDDS